MKRHYLYPGQVAAFQEETLISTLLGSCVAVALHDQEKKIGGLNHYLLPEGMENEAKTPRYGSFAIPQLIEEMVALGARRDHLRAKIYGGGNVIQAGTIGETVGQRNIQFAEKYLQSLRIPIIDRDTGGESARTIRFNTATFDVLHLLNRVQNTEAPVSISGYQNFQTAKSVKVLIVDDSATVRTLFQQIFAKAGLEVVGVAADPYQARELIVSLKPDVLTLDIEMPKMTGVEFLEKLMKHMPLPVVMVSSLGSQGDAAMRSLALGAIEFVHKPSQFDPAILKELAIQLVDKVKAAATVNVLKNRQKIEDHQTQVMKPTFLKKQRPELKAVVIGGNSGSVDSLEKLLCGLAADTPPVIIACSTVTTFLESFLQKLKGKTKVSLMAAKPLEFLQMGNVYFIPAGYHGEVALQAGRAVLQLKAAPPVFAQRPSSDVLFKSAAETLKGGVYGILLSSFGSDGVEGLTVLRSAGAQTVVQTPSEAQFPFGPQRAIEAGVVDEVLGVSQISQHLMDYRNRNV